jgi:hypothetical protein
MSRLGSYLFLFGATTILFKLAGENGYLIRWIDDWGEDLGWGLRIAFVVIGGALVWEEKRAAAKRQEQDAGPV